MISTSDETLPCPFCGTALIEKHGGLFHPEENDVADDCVLDGMSWAADYYRALWNTRSTPHNIQEGE